MEPSSTSNNNGGISRTIANSTVEEPQATSSSMPEEARTTTTNDDDDECSSSLRSCIPFFRAFSQATGTIPILILTILVGVVFGSVVGILPDIIADRYARTRHAYSGPDCSSFDRSEKPPGCQSGADDAQDAAAMFSLARNLLTLVFNPVVGSYSDRMGRRRVMLFSLFFSSLGPITFILLQLVPGMSPNFFYAAASMEGVVDLTSMSFAAFSDVLAPDMRSAGYGVLMAAVYGGLSLSPLLPLFMSHFHVSIFSGVCAVSALLLAFVFLPETLPDNIAEENRHPPSQQQNRPTRWSSSGSSYSDEEGSEPHFLLGNDQDNDATETHWIVSVAQTAIRPLKDMTILTHGNLPILAAASFFSAMVYATDKTFVMYYIEDQLNVRDDDIAKMFLIFCPLGVAIQAFFLQPMIRIVGEKQLMIIAFTSGVCHNLLYGLATSKNVILVALCLSQLTKVSFPLLASYSSRSASVNEQGRMQGALFALNALANAIGPMLLEIVYDHSKDGQGPLGPGSMFCVAASLYGVGTLLVAFLPAIDETSQNSSTIIPADDMLVSVEICAGEQPDVHDSRIHSLQAPLLDNSGSSLE